MILCFVLGESSLGSTARRVIVFLAALILLIGGISAANAGSRLYGFRMVQQENVMLHFDLDSAVATADLFTLSKPHRLVIDLPGTSLATQLPTERFTQGAVEEIRYAQHEGYLRIVLDLRRQVSPTSEFVPRQGGKRLVVNLGVKGHVALVQSRHRVQEVVPLRNAVVAIDAGHGGKDPGASGQRKTREKDVTLAIATKLFQRLQAHADITPVLIRDSDIFIGLRERMNIARKHGADLFVSIHADAINHNRAKGSSVYTLSIDGASSEAAAWLAKSESDSAALYGDVALNGMDDTLAQTILSLTQGATMESSMAAGAQVLEELKQVGAVHKPAVEQAGFAVLKAPDIPSMLIETAFITNLQEEKKLNSARFQGKLAEAIASGVAQYLARRAPEGTYQAAARRKHGS